ncbi:MAG: hypothetical protein GX130_04010 [Candidatus Hydrogenedens sp.]|nr:hypothetical protein [Candidatus Hydrogenedens sp.]
MTDKNNSPSTVSRRTFLKRSASTLTAAALSRTFHIGKAGAAPKGRVIMLGYDGLEPSIAEAMMERGDMPNFARLKELGGSYRLGSTIPPQSPVAWSSYATCKNPGAHNIFDFIRRTPNGPAGPMPLVGTGKLVPPVISPQGIMQEGAKAENYRKGIPFWSVADEQGKRGKILNIPFAFPPDPLKNGIMLSALGVPDLRGTTSTYFSLSDRFTPEQLAESLGGGKRILLSFDGSDEARLPIPGPRDNRYPFADAKAYTEALLIITADRKNKQALAKTGHSQVELVQGQWSEWLEFSFKMTDKDTVMGIARFFPTEIGEQIRLYMSCVQYHPDHPYSALTQPEDYSAELKGRFGLYKTIGWAYDTHALRQMDLDEDAFLADIKNTMAWRNKLTLDEHRRGDYDFLLSGWTATDRIGHLFWRFRDEKHPLYEEEVPERWKYALEDCYKEADAFVGQMLSEIQEDDHLFVFSDHGFGTWRTGFNLNSWLQEQGYLNLSDPKAADTGFLMGIDWTKTKAYSVGLSSLYINLQGRERFGTVKKEEAVAFREELINRLADVKDPATGAKVFSALYTSDEYSGEAEGEAPDISLGYAEAFQSGRQTSRGGVGDPLFETVTDKWSGEHASSDYRHCPGICLANKPLEKETPHIQDLGVTALKLLGVDMPSDLEGDALV